MREATRTPAGGRRLVTAALAAALAALSGCDRMPELSNPFAGAAGPAAVGPAAVPNLSPDGRGVITYASYQVIVARAGDDMASVAGRVGITPDELASRNALPSDYMLRAGEVLLLPDSVPRPAGGFGPGAVTTQPLDWSPERAAAAIDAGSGTAANPFDGGQTDPLIDPVRHRVEPGETAYSIARLYGVSTTALASWNGLGPDLAVRENQELLIPIVSDANRITGAPNSEPGESTPIGAPPSAAGALPDDTAVAAAPASPNLGAQRTPPGGRLSAPVSAAVSRPYDASNPNGVGYAVAPGTPVRAAASGEVALISEELGGLGAIVLIRHRDDLMTTYATLSDVAVRQGDAVQAGQIIGEVSPRDRPELQFDVFRGTTSVDPTPYIGG